MIAVPVAAIMARLETTKGKSGAQIEVERELKAILDKRKIQSVTEDELAALFEEAAVEVAFRAVTAKMRSEGKVPDLTPTKH